MRTKPEALAVAILAILTAPNLYAESGSTFAVDWSTIAGGGSVSRSDDGRWLLAGTAGQPDAGIASGSTFALEGGFWSSVLCAYGLRITHFRNDLTAEMPVYVMVTWPTDGQGECVLEATPELHNNPSLNVWMPVPVGRVGSLNAYVAPAGGPARFFRLRGGTPSAP